jgi:hypothetical protein
MDTVISSHRGIMRSRGVKGETKAEIKRRSSNQEGDQATIEHMIDTVTARPLRPASPAGPLRLELHVCCSPVTCHSHSAQSRPTMPTFGSFTAEIRVDDVPLEEYARTVTTPGAGSANPPTVECWIPSAVGKVRTYSTCPLSQ